MVFTCRNCIHWDFDKEKIEFICRDGSVKYYSYCKKHKKKVRSNFYCKDYEDMYTDFKLKEWTSED